MAELDRLLDYIRTQQSLNVPRELRIVLESKQPPAVEAVQADVEAAYRLTVSVTPPFGGFGEEGTGDPRFLLLRIPGVSIGELAKSPFVLAYDLVDRLHLVSARFRVLLAATARVPEGLNTDNFGAGIVDADRLLERDPESLSAPAAGSELVGDRFISIKSLVSEATSGLESAPTTIGAFDWNRHALEASYLSLRVARSRKAQSSLATKSGRVEAASRAPRFGSSAQFRQDAAASGDPRLIAMSQVR